MKNRRIVFIIVLIASSRLPDYMMADETPNPPSLSLSLSPLLFFSPPPSSLSSLISLIHLPIVSFSPHSHVCTLFTYCLSKPLSQISLTLCLNFYCLIRSALFCSPLFCSQLFCSQLFRSQLFRSQLFCSQLFRSQLFRSSLFRSPLFRSPCTECCELLDFMQRCLCVCVHYDVTKLRRQSAGISCVIEWKCNSPVSN